MTQYIVVWDPLVRIGHWTILLAFAVAYLSREDLLTVHVGAGYIIRRGRAHPRDLGLAAATTLIGFSCA
jgi:cytochrome b